MPDLLLGEASSLALQIQRFCGDHDFVPQISHRPGSQLSTAKSLTSLGLAVTVLPKSAQRHLIRRGSVSGITGPSQPSRDIALVRHRRRHLGKGALLFAELARTVARPRAGGRHRHAVRLAAPSRCCDLSCTQPGLAKS